ncbi:MAG: bis(5'-nucleosyl)-tetraphosphatase (symmetrical) YqeK [Elainellaceae cyanobacterium]
MVSGLSQQQRTDVLDWLSDHVPKSRIKHVLRVEEMAVDLAQQHGLSVSHAAQAGLMHDLAKYFSPEQLIAIATSNGIEIDSVFQANPHLLHADVSAIVARDEFGIRAPAVLEAIANHTLGRPSMDELSCVVFLADSLEPGRGMKKSLEELREISYRDLEKAVWKTCDYTFEKLIGNQRLIHPRALLTRNWFLQSAKQKHET